MDTQGLKQDKEPTWQVTYRMYLASGGQLSYTLSVERVESIKQYVKCSLFTLTPFSNYVTLT